MEPRIQYAKTEDGVSIAYSVEGEGTPLLMTPLITESFVLEEVSPAYRRFSRRLAESCRLIQYDPRNVGSSQRTIGTRGSHWYSSERGLFSDRSHLCLQEHTWDSATNTATIRYFIVDALSGDVSGYAQTFQAYTDAEFRSLLVDYEFDDVQLIPGLADGSGDSTDGLMAVVARRREPSRR